MERRNRAPLFGIQLFQHVTSLFQHARNLFSRNNRVRYRKGKINATIKNLQPNSNYGKYSLPIKLNDDKYSSRERSPLFMILCLW